VGCELGVGERSITTAGSDDARVAVAVIVNGEMIGWCRDSGGGSLGGRWMRIGRARGAGRAVDSLNARWVRCVTPEARFEGVARAVGEERGHARCAQAC
jgi:hypothetical protein